MRVQKKGARLQELNRVLEGIGNNITVTLNTVTVCEGMCVYVCVCVQRKGARLQELNRVLEGIGNTRA
jgi:hypothetical protein